MTATGGITSLEQRGVRDFTLYDNGWKIVLPSTVSGRFPDATNTAIERVMMVYRCPNGMIVKDDDRDGFRRTCLQGLWGLHSERALIRCTHNTADGRDNKVIGVNVCPMCRFWNTNDVTLNNHVRKHYNMGLCCPEDGYVTGSANRMRKHRRTNTTTRCVLARISKPTSRLPRRLHIKESPSGSQFKCR